MQKGDWVSFVYEFRGRKGTMTGKVVSVGKSMTRVRVDGGGVRGAGFTRGAIAEIANDELKLSASAHAPHNRSAKNPMTYGTSYFVNRSAADRYYASQGESKADVTAKLREGSISIGKPPVKAGERLSLVDGGKRYAITSKNPAAPVGKWIAAKAVRQNADGTVSVQTTGDVKVISNPSKSIQLRPITGRRDSGDVALQGVRPVDVQRIKQAGYGNTTIWKRQTVPALRSAAKSYGWTVEVKAGAAKNPGCGGSRNPITWKTITSRMVGKYLEGFGYVTKKDVGKKYYTRDGSAFVENDAQMKAQAKNPVSITATGIWNELKALGFASPGKNPPRGTAWRYKMGNRKTGDVLYMDHGDSHTFSFLLTRARSSAGETYGRGVVELKRALESRGYGK